MKAGRMKNIRDKLKTVTCIFSFQTGDSVAVLTFVCLNIPSRLNSKYGSALPEKVSIGGNFTAFLQVIVKTPLKASNDSFKSYSASSFSVLACNTFPYCRVLLSADANSFQAL